MIEACKLNTNVCNRSIGLQSLHIFKQHALNRNYIPHLVQTNTSRQNIKHALTATAHGNCNPVIPHCLKERVCAMHWSAAQKIPQSRTIYCTAAVHYCQCVSISYLHFGRMVWYFVSSLPSHHHLLIHLILIVMLITVFAETLYEYSPEILCFDTSHGFKQLLTFIPCSVESV